MSDQDAILGVVVAISHPRAPALNHQVAILGDCLPAHADSRMLADLCLPCMSGLVCSYTGTVSAKAGSSIQSKALPPMAIGEHDELVKSGVLRFQRPNNSPGCWSVPQPI